jgi:DNA-binding winged helix-turn-helix (wHTH) protein
MGRWLEFPPFRLDTVEEQLWRDAQPVALRAKNYAVLRHLVESAGCLVSTEELFKAIWPSAVVTPGTLNTTIREVRRALGVRRT